ncbi:MAG: PAS domain S-box protein [gamma proteobacterium symbiont of Taylorina sp.]|nr:PAS domain S-box protein [gamma proteobacterium symbiont of Taylorina sp.]
MEQTLNLSADLNLNEIPANAIKSSRIYLQLILYLLGFVLLAMLEYYFSNLSNELLEKINTENIRVQIGGIINDDIRKIETLTYKLATSKGKKRQSNFKKKLDYQTQQLNRALQVLSNGGTINRIKRLNLINKNIIEQKINYKNIHIDSQYILEIIELQPKIDKMRKMVDKLTILIQRRDEQSFQSSYKEKAILVKNHLQLISPLFERIIENSNRLYYESQQRLVLYKETFSERKKYYTNLQILLSLIIILLVLLFGYFILRQVQNANNKLNETSKELNFQIKALNSHAIVSSTDIEGNITQVNQRFCEISGYSEEELIGSNHRMVKSKEHTAEYFKVLWDTISSGEIWHGEIKNISKTGSIYWVNATIVPLLDNNNKPFRYIAIRNDITRRKKMEEEINKSHRFLQSMTDAMGEGVYTLDKDGFCTSVNPEFEHLTGWEKEDIIHQNLHELIHFQTIEGTFVPANECPTHKSIKNGKKYTSDDEYFTHKNGTLYPVSIISVPLYENNEVTGSVAIFQDISIRKAIEAALIEAKSQAEQASKDKSNFLANMSHEIRTPMNAIIGMSYLALETELTPEQHNYIQKVHYSAESLLKIINDILDFSKIEAGKLEIENIEFEFQEIITNVSNILSEKSLDNNIKLNFNIDENIPKVLIGDGLRLNQILINLGNNALKFTENGNVTISAQIDSRTSKLLPDQGSTIIHFSIKDDGIGISQEQQSKLFKSFSQADASTTRKYGGTGLGLSISQQLTELMGGKIWLESQLGKGSTFHFTIQFQTVENIEKSQNKLQNKQTKKQSYKDSAEILSGANILLVEDNAFNQELTMKLLKKNNINVIVANNGQEALEHLELEKFDGILMDIQMPVMDGYEATHRIRMNDRLSHLPIIAMTANSMTGDAEKASQAGMNDYISKPININKMFNTMAKWIKPDQQLKIQNKNSTDNSFLTTQISPGIDYDNTLHYRFEDDKDLYHEILNIFINEHADNINEIIKALSEGNQKDALLIAHTLKGVSANIGALQLNETLIKLESCLKSSENTHLECREILETASHRLDKDITEIEQFLSHTKHSKIAHTETKKLTASEIGSILKELLSLVESYDTKASKQLQTIYKMSFAQKHIDTFNLLKECINRYDFEQGSHILSELIKKIESSE